MAKFEPQKAKATRDFPTKGTFYCLAREPEGRLFAGCDDFGIHVYDPKAKDTKKPAAVWNQHESYVDAIVWKPGGTPGVISGGFDSRLIWWDAEGKAIRRVDGHAGWVRDLALTPDGQHLLSAGDDMLVKVWDAESGKAERSFEGHEKATPQGHVTALYTVAVSPDGKFVASGDRIGHVRVWEFATGKLVQKIEVPTVYTYDPRQRKRSLGGVRCLRFSPDGSLLAVGGMGQVGNVDGLGGKVHLELWDWRNAKQRLVSNIRGHNGYLNDCYFHPTEPWLIGAGTSFVGSWKIDALPEKPDPKKKEPVPTHLVKDGGHIHQIVADPDGNAFYAANYRKLQLWTFPG